MLNYFTTLNLPGSGDDDIARGAESPLELSRQQAKIIDALAEIDADVFGLIEIENNGDVALKTLTDALNAHLGSEVYRYIATGKIGTDVITTALMYKPATVEPLGAFQLMNGAADPAWDDNLHRPGLTQTFGAVETDEKFTVVVNHLKSKGSACATGNDPQQGNCNGPRTAAAKALATWLATDPTGQGTVGRELIIGDLNAYDKEDPITALTGAGYTDLLLKYQGEDAYTYVFDGQLGYLDHGLAGPGLLADVTGAARVEHQCRRGADPGLQRQLQVGVAGPGVVRAGRLPLERPRSGDRRHRSRHRPADDRGHRLAHEDLAAEQQAAHGHDHRRRLPTIRARSRTS